MTGTPALRCSEPMFEKSARHALDQLVAHYYRLCVLRAAGWSTEKAFKESSQCIRCKGVAAR